MISSTTRKARFSAIPKALPAEVARPRLLGLLERARDVKLIALIAPSGYGKTTLLAQFARNAYRRVVWLNLNMDNADPEVFAQAIYQALATVLGELEATKLTPTHLAGQLDQAEENITLILEGIDHLGPESVRWLQTFIATLMEGHQVIVSGYESVLPLARYLSEGTACLIGPEQLGFSPEECAEYLKIRNSTLDPAQAHGQLEGWPAGLALATSGGSGSLGLGPTDLILEVLGNLPSAVRSALPQAAVLEVWNEAHLQQLGSTLPPGWLHEVRRAGILLIPLGAGNHRPHKLLLEVLERELRGSPERHQAMHRAAALEAEAAGAVLEALNHYRLAGLEAQALNLAQQIVDRYTARWEYRLIRQVLESFPENQLPPSLAAALGRALVETKDVVRGEALLRRLYASGHRNLETIIGLSVLAEYRGDEDILQGLIQEGLALCDTEAQRMGFVRRQAVLYWKHGQFDRGLELAEHIIEWAEKNNYLYELATGLDFAQVSYSMLGKQSESEREGLRALGVYETLGMPARSINVMNTLATLYCFQGRFEEALKILQQAIAIGQREEHTLLPQLLETHAEIYFWQADFQRAVTGYYEALKSCGKTSVDWLAQRIRLRFVDAAYRAGQGEAAARAMSRAWETLPKEGTPLFCLFKLVEGMEAVFLGDISKAEQCFEVLIPQRMEGGDYARALTYQAEIARREGRLERKHIEALVHQLDTLGGDVVLRIETVALAPLFAECIQRGWWPERFAPFTRSQVDISTTKSSGLELHLTTFGRFHGEIAEMALHSPLTKANELLIWLVLNGPGTREQIMEALWEGSTEQRHLEYFKVAVRRLRAALSEHPALGDLNPVLFEGGRYFLNEHLSVWLDAQQIAKALGSADPQALQAALETYKGPFFPESDTGWAQGLRLKLQEEALAVAMHLGELQEAQGHPEAPRTYRRASEIEPLSEAAHLAQIRVLQAYGDLPAARRAYKVYARMLAEEFGSTPSPDLMRLFEG